MPRHHDPDADLSPSFVSAAAQIGVLLNSVLDPSLGSDTYEGQLKGVLDASGRQQMRTYLSDSTEKEAFEEEGTKWSVALRDCKQVMTLFGWVQVKRPLFRSRRNGPTRCLVAERANLIDGKWTPRAARVAAVGTTELSFERTEQFFEQLGGMAPSKTLLLGLDRHLSELWEQDREAHENQVRESSEIPAEAVACGVSLDGVMVNMVGSDRAEKKERAKASGKIPRGPNGYREASVGVLSFYDADGERLATWRMARMPESDKATTKAWLEAELTHVREQRPDMTVLAAADGAPNNWSFLERLEPDEQVVDYYHATQHLYHKLSKLSGVATEETQRKFREWKGQLLEQDDGAKTVFAELAALQKQAGTEPKTTRKRHPTYFERHHGRMDYAKLREQKLPIGTGVTEGTCRHLVVDRLRRSGMAWSESGGQAVMTLRSLAVSNRYEIAWCVLARANEQRLRRAG